MVEELVGFGDLVGPWQLPISRQIDFQVDEEELDEVRLDRTSNRCIFLTLARVPTLASSSVGL